MATRLVKLSGQTDKQLDYLNQEVKAVSGKIMNLFHPLLVTQEIDEQALVQFDSEKTALAVLGRLKSQSVNAEGQPSGAQCGIVMEDAPVDVVARAEITLRGVDELDKSVVAKEVGFLRLRFPTLEFYRNAQGDACVSGTWQQCAMAKLSFEKLIEYQRMKSWGPMTFPSLVTGDVQSDALQSFMGANDQRLPNTNNPFDPVAPSPMVNNGSKTNQLGNSTSIGNDVNLAQDSASGVSKSPSSADSPSKVLWPSLSSSADKSALRVALPPGSAASPTTTVATAKPQKTGFIADDCPVCLEPLDSAANVVLLQCRHRLCRDCLSNLRRSGRQSCPFCFSPIVEVAATDAAAAAAAAQPVKSPAADAAVAKAFVPVPPVAKPTSPLHWATRNQTETDNCPLCTAQFDDRKSKSTPLKCGHPICRSCYDDGMRKCPVCSNLVTTPAVAQKCSQPDGEMAILQSSRRLPGFENDATCRGTIEITYLIPNGVQSQGHPNPGKPYTGTERTAYLPDNAEGQLVLRLLRRAFDAKLTFKIGVSQTTGCDNTVVWNGIPHKTNISGGPSQFGYPDPNYLAKVKQYLAGIGIVE